MTRKGKILLVLIFLFIIIAAGLYLFVRTHNKLKPERSRVRKEVPLPTKESAELPDLREPESSEELFLSVESLLPDSIAVEVIQHKGFVLGYWEKYEQPAWVMHLLEAPESKAKRFRRRDNFREDPLVSTLSASPEDYLKSGYDRGHLAPAADLSYDEEVLSESFYMSNMSPQRPAFNRGIWNVLENQVREFAVTEGRLIVVTGPVFGKRPRRIGENRVSVPKGFYKILFDIQEPELKMLAFLLPHRGSQASLSSFTVSVDSVEELSGLDFFAGLPDSLENSLEINSQYSAWSFAN